MPYPPPVHAEDGLVPSPLCSQGLQGGSRQPAPGGLPAFREQRPNLEARACVRTSVQTQEPKSVRSCSRTLSCSLDNKDRFLVRTVSAGPAGGLRGRWGQERQSPEPGEPGAAGEGDGDTRGGGEPCSGSFCARVLADARLRRRLLGTHIGPVVMRSGSEHNFPAHLLPKARLWCDL